MKIGKNKNHQGMFDQKAKDIKAKHWSQSAEEVASLCAKYEKPIFGEVEPFWMIEQLALCVDMTDRELYGVSQYIHTLQVLESMEISGITDEEFLLAGLMHDAGKILLLTDEKPENIVCDNGVITEAVGWANCVTHWNHDEFMYCKLKDHVPEHVAWIIRYHSMKSSKEAEACMDATDRKWAEKYLVPFKEHDKLTKSIHNIPKLDMDKYRRLVEKHLPKKLMI